MGIRHAKVSVLPDGADASQVQPSDWNAEHVGLSGTEFPADPVLGDHFIRTDLCGGKGAEFVFAYDAGSDRNLWHGFQTFGEHTIYFEEGATGDGLTPATPTGDIAVASALARGLMRANVTVRIHGNAGSLDIRGIWFDSVFAGISITGRDGYDSQPINPTVVVPTSQTGAVITLSAAAPAVVDPDYPRLLYSRSDEVSPWQPVGGVMVSTYLDPNMLALGSGAQVVVGEGAPIYAVGQPADSVSYLTVNLPDTSGYCVISRLRSLAVTIKHGGQDTSFLGVAVATVFDGVAQYVGQSEPSAFYAFSAAGDTVDIPGMATSVTIRARISNWSGGAVVVADRDPAIIFTGGPIELNGGAGTLTVIGYTPTVVPIKVSPFTRVAEIYAAPTFLNCGAPQTTGAFSEYVPFV